MRNVLIVFKKSLFRFYFLDRRNPGFKKGLRLGASIKKELRSAHDQHYQTLSYVEKILMENKIKYRKCNRGQNINYAPFDFVITVGGDGTFLEAARSIKKQIILGVNSDPTRSIGRFCAATRKNFKAIFLKAIHGTCRTKVFSRIKLKTSHTPRSVNVLNDILIAHMNPAAMSRYRLAVNGVKENQRSSGLWIATAAGSSGAIHSAGGKVLPSDSIEIQFRPRELFKHHEIRYRLRGSVISLKRPMTVCSMMRHGIIYVDGAHARLPFSFGESVSISVSNEPLTAVY